MLLEGNHYYLCNVVSQYLFHILLVLSMQRDGVFFISGDVHFGEITRYDCAVDYPLYDVTSSGVTQSVEGVVPSSLHFLVRFVAWLTPSTLRVKGQNCRHRSCVYGNVLLLIFLDKNIYLGFIVLMFQVLAFVC